MLFIGLLFLTLLSTRMCRATDHEFIIVADLDNRTIFTGPIDTLQLQRIPLKNIERPVAVDYDPVEHRVYWTDETILSINSAFVNGTGQEQLVTLETQSVPYGLTIDVENRHMYWTDEGLNLIERANLDGSSRQIIIQDNLDKPRGIVVDPAGWHIYWTEYGVKNRIERSSLNGTERVTLVDSNLNYPYGIALDFEDQRIFWCDAGTNKVESTDLNGSDRQVHFNINNPDIHPFDISVTKDDIYWTDWRVSRILRAQKNVAGIAENVGSIIFQKAGGLHIHEVHDNSCSRNTCEHDSRCRQLDSGYQCVCLPGFSGTFCQTDINECSSGPCINNGQCIDGINGYICQCAVGWTGDNCDLDENECIQSPSPCHANADCSNTQGSYTCQCQPGYAGDGDTTCTEVDNCDPNPCENGGNCTNRINDFDCSCINGFTGKICDISPSDPCRYQPCRNGATCMSVGDEVLCQCDDGYSGDLCETDIDECSSDPCQHGAICNDLVNRFFCDCNTGYEGDFCESRAAIGCPYPGDLTNGHVIHPQSHDTNSGKYLPGKRLEFVCEENHKLQGTKVIYCQIDYTWSDEKPSCIQEAGGSYTSAIIGGGVSIGLIIAILVTILIAVCINKSRNTGRNDLLERPRHAEPPVPKDQRPFTPHAPSHYTAAYDNRSEALYESHINTGPRKISNATYAEIPELGLYEMPSSNTAEFASHSAVTVVDLPEYTNYNHRPPSRLPPGIPQGNPPAYDTLRKNAEMELKCARNCASIENADTVMTPDNEEVMLDNASSVITNSNASTNENTDKSGNNGGVTSGRLEDANSSENVNSACTENAKGVNQENGSSSNNDDASKESDYIHMKEGIKVEMPRMPNKR